ncbi:hypothetical protein AB0K00_10310 [Dactylosporangium sp. NPDC049525]|uniref:hypothetical protein n=1 Tax=Dactylosporangium sp. NPDC049525 TaxID=3154730 RepID=UPI003444D267
MLIVGGIVHEDDLNRLKEAVRLVQSDLGWSGIPEQIGLELAGRDGDVDAYHVALSDGQFWAGAAGLDGSSKRAAARSVAIGAQDLVAELLGIAWPVCPEHRRVLTVPSEAEAAEEPLGDGPVWRCPVHGHDWVAAVGHLSDAFPFRA